jgi:hypothetical protein
MREGLGATLTQAQWINNGYLLPLSALILLGGALGDRFGVARAFGAGIVVFVIASLLCAIAPTSRDHDRGPRAEGHRRGGDDPRQPRADRPRLSARRPGARHRHLGRGVGADHGARPILGGVALSLGGPEVWRLLFAINLPLGALALWLLWRHVREDPSGPAQPARLARRAFDQRGARGTRLWPDRQPKAHRLAPPQRRRARLRVVPLAGGADPLPHGPARAFPRPRLRCGQSRDLPDLLRAVHRALLPADDAHRRMGHGGGHRVRRLRPALRLHLDALGALGPPRRPLRPRASDRRGRLIVALSFAGSPSASARRMSGSASFPRRRSWASAWRWSWRRCRPRS